MRFLRTLSILAAAACVAAAARAQSADPLATPGARTPLDPPSPLLGGVGMTDRGEWIVAAGGDTTLVDFDSILPWTDTSGTGALVPWGILDTTGTSIHADPPVVDQFVSTLSLLGFEMFEPGTLPSEPNFLCNDPTWPDGPAATGRMTIVFTEPRIAVGFFVTDRSPVGGIEVSAFDGTRLVAQQVFPPRALPDSFVGIVSGEPFDRVALEPESNDDSWGLDDLEHIGVSIGTHPCDSLPNSTGWAAELHAFGSTSIAANDLRLAAVGVPSQFGIFFFGTTPGNAPFGNGILCVSGSLTRLLPPVVAEGLVAKRGVDLQQLGLHPGTLHFQYWFRDPAGGAAKFNTSGSVALDLVP